MAVIDSGSDASGKANVTPKFSLSVAGETDAISNADNIGGFRNFSENDQGYVTGVTRIKSPEVDVDFRQRMSQDVILDEENFNYTAQNTGKHSYLTTTLTNTWTAGQLTTNGSSITTINTGTVFSTYAAFPNTGTTTLSADVECGFSAQPTSNTFIEFGLGIPSTALVAPTDGVFLRLNSAGLQGIASFNGAETSTGVFPLTGGTGTWVYTNNKRYQFIIYMGGVEAQFWVNDGTGPVMLGEIPLPNGQGRMTMAAGMRFFIKHRIVGGAAGGVIQGLFGAYNVRQGGVQYAIIPGTAGNRIYGSYQGLSGGTMGSTATYPNSTNPTAAAPSNTALTANLPGGIGGQGSVIAAVAAATDGIWGSFQVPAGTANVQGRRLAVRGVLVDLINIGAAVATTATTIQFSFAFGHTAVSLATAEGVASKAPRRVPVGFATWAVGAAIGSQPQSGRIFLDLGDAPIFINPGEFGALVGKFIAGTATASQVISFVWLPVHGWE